MSELVFLKLGGSLLTDKTRPQSLRSTVLARLAEEIAAARLERPELRLLIGHGSGSFGHVTASRYGTRSGVRSREEWRGYAETARIAAELNRLVVEALWDAGVPALRIQPSASALCHDGELRSMTQRPLIVALDHGLVPVVYGDVALDEVRGGTIISTEEIFVFLAPQHRPARIVLVGEVEGVLTADPSAGTSGEVVRVITPALFPHLEETLGASRGIDVTGGMITKVRAMLKLVEASPGLQGVHIVSGLAPGVVQEVLVGNKPDRGTYITSG